MISRAAACLIVSSRSTKPPGSAHLPPSDSLAARLTSSRRSPSSTRLSTTTWRSAALFPFSKEQLIMVLSDESYSVGALVGRRLGRRPAKQLWIERMGLDTERAAGSDPA